MNNVPLIGDSHPNNAKDGTPFEAGIAFNC